MTTYSLVPGQSIQAALTAGGAGTIINLAAGIYRGQTITSNVNNFQLIGDPGGGTIIDGSIVLNGWTLTPATGFMNAGTWTSNQSFSRVTPQSNSGYYTAGSLAQYGEEVFFNGVRLTPTTTNPPPAGCWYWNAGQIVLSQNPVGQLVEIAQLTNFFTGGNGSSGELMQDLTIQKYASAAGTSPYAAVLAGPSSTYTRCTFQYNHACGLTIFNTNATVQNCKMLYNGLEGYSGYGSTGLIFTGNEVAYNGIANFNPLNEGGAGKIGNSTSGTFTNNFVHDNYGTGAWWDSGNTGFTVQNNLIYQNYGPGISCEISTGVNVSYNCCLRNGVGVGLSNPAYPAEIIISNSGTCTIEYNFCEVAPYGGSSIIQTYDSTRSQTGSTYGSGNLYEYNTSIFNDASGHTGLYYYNGNTGATGFTETFSNNTYYTSSSTSDPHFSYWDNTTHTFASWKSSYSFDTTGSTLTVQTWPATNVLFQPSYNASISGAVSLINKANAPCALWGGIAGETYDQGGFAWPSHIWLRGGANTLIVRAGQVGMIVHDWVTGGGTNSLVLAGYTFATVSAALAALSTSGSNVVLTLTDSNTVTFIGATTGAFTSSNVSLGLPATSNAARTSSYLLNSDFQDGQAAGSITPGRVRELIVSAFAQASGPPTSGTFAAGAVIWNSAPTVMGNAGSQYLVLGWSCTVAGTPGVWAAIQTPTGT